MNYFSRFVTALGQMIVLTVVLFVFLNLVAVLFLKVEDLRAARRFKRTAWWTDYISQAKQHRVRWIPYSYWISAPLKEKYINIDPNGLRHTWHNGMTNAASTENLFRIFMFGGSTMYGHGATDDYTIPSVLVKDLAQRGISGVEITNFGQPGYVSTQEIILLFAQLRRRNIPDLVIFYDGYNDTYSAFQNGQPGVTENEANRAREFNLTNTNLPEARRQLYWFTAKTFVGHLPIVGMMVIGLRNIMPGMPLKDLTAEPGGIWSWEHLGSPPQGLARSTAQTYLDNMHFVAEVGRRMGFSSLFYWQPTLYTKAGLSPDEAKIVATDSLAKNASPFFQQVNHELYSAASTAPYKADRLEFLTDVLPATKSCYFSDFMHVVGDCNEIIARKMANDVIPIVIAARRAEEDRNPLLGASPDGTLQH
jgi:hypothetical protein